MFPQAALDASNEVMSSPLPRVHEEAAAGVSVESIGGAEFKADQVAKVRFQTQPSSNWTSNTVCPGNETVAWA